MTIDYLIEAIPAYADDIRRQLQDLMINKDKEGLLTTQQLYSLMLSIGYSLKYERLLNHVRAEARGFLSEEEADACKIAAIMMSMNNTYYNFVSLLEDPEVSVIKSGLHSITMSSIATDRTTFEICCLGVSILNGCKYCIKAHTKKLLHKEEGVSKDLICEVARVTATLRTIRDVLEIDRMRSYDFIAREATI